MRDSFSCFQLDNLTTSKIVKFQKPGSFHANSMSHQMWGFGSVSNTGEHDLRGGEVPKMVKTFGFRSKFGTFELWVFQNAQVLNPRDSALKR